MRDKVPLITAGGRAAQPTVRPTMVRHRVIRLGLAIVAAAGILFLVAIWEAFVTPAPSIECIHESKDSDAILPACGIVHYYHDPSALELAARIAIVFLTLAGVSTIAARAEVKAGILAGAIATMFAALLAFALLFVHALAHVQVNYHNSAMSAVVLALASAAYGATAAWVVLRWWPNNSLERTRAR